MGAIKTMKEVESALPKRKAFYVRGLDKDGNPILTLADELGGGSGGTGYMEYITEYNVSVQHPTSGIDGSNKYSLEGAIAQVPQELRNIGLKVSFINSDGKVETWEFQGGTFTDVDGWKQQVQRTEIMKLKQEDLLLEEANNTNAKFISDWGWRKGNRDYATGEFKEGPYFVSDIVNVEGESFDFQSDENAEFVCC